MLWYKVRDSVETTDEKDKRSQKARQLYHYLNNNKDGLLPYQKQGRKIPEAKRRNPIQKYGCAGISKLHGHYHEDETPPDEMVCERGK